MIGKIVLAIFGMILILLLVALLIPVYIRISYEQGELRVSVKYAKFSIPVIPKAEQEPQTEAAQERTDQPEQQEVKSKEKSGINREQVVYTIDTLPPILLKTLRRFGRRIRLEPLKVHVLVAASDPADTAILYGKLHGFLAAFLPPLHRSITIREQDIQLFPDFSEESMDYIADIGIGMRPGSALLIILCALGGVLKWYIGFRKRATKVPGKNGNNKDTTAQAEKAA